MSYHADSENNVITYDNLTLKTCQNKVTSAVNGSVWQLQRPRVNVGASVRDTTRGHGIDKSNTMLPEKRKTLSTSISQSGHQQDIYLLTFGNAPTPPPQTKKSDIIAD